MIVSAYYINQDTDRAVRDTGLALDEIEMLVGRFRASSTRAGQLRGEVVQLADGAIKIRHHFSKKTLWEG